MTRRLQGPAGTNVEITIDRPATSPTRTIALTRAVIHVVSARGRLVAPGYALIEVTAFQEDAAAD